MNLEQLQREAREEFEEGRWNHTQDGMYWAFLIVESITKKAFLAGVNETVDSILAKFPTEDTADNWRAFTQIYYPTDIVEGVRTNLTQGIEKLTESV